MKIFISADIEGIAGVTLNDECDPEKAASKEYQERMTEHVAAACKGALAGGATEILVKDAHWNAQNIDASALPRQARLVKGWSGHPLCMVQEIDATFDAAMFVGYHARAGSGGNALSHTLSGSKVALMELNGRPVAEYHVHALAAAMFDVPVVMLSGDQALCDDAKEFCPALTAVPVMSGTGTSSTSLHPDEARDRIHAGAEASLEEAPAACRLDMPDHFELKVWYMKPRFAYPKSFYPGVELLDDVTVAFSTEDYFEIMRALSFIIY